MANRSIHKFICLCFSLAVALFLVVSCVQTQQYPDEWSARRSGDEAHCPDISGTYVNLADTLELEADSGGTDGEREEPIPTKIVKCHADEDGTIEPACFLSILFSPEYKQYLGRFPSFYSMSEHVDYLVELKQANDGSLSVHVTYKEDGTPVDSYRHDIRESRIRCENGAYKWSYGLSEGLGGYGLMAGSISHTLDTSEDGSLVLDVRMKAAGLVLVVPTVLGTNQWYKWDKYEAP